MKTNFYFKMILLVLAFGFISCESDDSDEDMMESELLTANLSECIWFAFSFDDDTIAGHTVDFSNNDIEVFNTDGTLVDEGNWEIQDGQVIFSALTGVLSNFNGTWTVSEDRDVFLELENNGMVINFEQDCQ